MFHGNVQRACQRQATRRFCKNAEPAEPRAKHSYRGRNRPVRSKLLKSGHAIIDLQRNYGEDFQHVEHKEKTLRTDSGQEGRGNWKNQRELKFVKDIVAAGQKDETIAMIDQGDDSGKRLVPFARVQEREHNWNPYQDSTTWHRHKVMDGFLSQVPESYRQGGFGMQAHPRWNSRYWKIWPTQRLMKRAIQSGRNLHNTHLLYNPLLEGGQRQDDVGGDNYIDIFHPNHVDQIPALSEESEQLHTERFAAKRFIQETLEGEEYNLSTLPPYKSGFEDVPVKKEQNDFWFPGYDLETQRRRELKVKFSVLVKHIRPKLTAQQVDALEELMKLSNIKRQHHRDPRFLRKTGEIVLMCKDCYTREENERRVLEWFTKLISEARKLGDSPEVGNWDEYQAKWAQMWAEEDRVEQQKKATWKQRMLAVPEFARKNANLYLAGPRMRKAARYADNVYGKMVDAGSILQRDGPRSSNPLGFWKDEVPMNIDHLRSDIDHLPADPKDFGKFFSLWKQIYNGKVEEDTPIPQEKYGLTKNLTGRHLVASAGETKLGKAKARRAVHNWKINATRNMADKMNQAEYDSLQPFWVKDSQTGQYGHVIDGDDTIQNTMSYDEASKHWWDNPFWGQRSSSHIPIYQLDSNGKALDRPLYPTPTPHVQQVIKKLKVLPKRAYKLDRIPVAPVFKKFIPEMPPESMKGVRKRSRAKPPTKDELEAALLQREREKVMIEGSMFFQDLTKKVQRMDEDKLK